MAHSLSARKRVRQSGKLRMINRARKSMVKTQIKQFLSALDAGNAEQASEQYRLLTKKVDQVAAKNTIPKNTASRIKSRLARRLNALQVKAAG